jgi:hypothetical protein
VYIAAVTHATTKEQQVERRQEGQAMSSSSSVSIPSDSPGRSPPASLAVTGLARTTAKTGVAVSFDVEKLRAGGYKFKKLQALCKAHSLRKDGTQKQLTARLLRFFETRPGAPPPPPDLGFSPWMQYRALAHTASLALSGASPASAAAQSELGVHCASCSTRRHIPGGVHA